jgi:serine protease Do
MAMRIVDSLKSDGRVTRAYLGVLPQDLDQTMADYYGLDRPQGVLVAQVNDDTPAQKAGLEDGDIILTVDGEKIRNASDLRNTISLSDVGEKVELRIIRDGKEKKLQVKLDALPEPGSPPRTAAAAMLTRTRASPAWTVREINNRTRAMMDLPEAIDGLLVMSVARGSNAADQGLAEGDIIVEVANREISSFDDLRSALKVNKTAPCS